MDLIDTRMLLYKNTLTAKEEKKGVCRHQFIKPSCFPITIVILFVLLVVLLPLLNSDFQEDEVPEWEKSGICNFSCRAFLTESIPENLTYTRSSFIGNDTFAMWSSLLTNARKDVDLVTFYWSLLAEDTASVKFSANSTTNFNKFNDSLGREIYRLIEEAGKRVKMRIAQNLGKNETMRESLTLEDSKLATVRSLNFSKWFGSGVLHTKLWITDRQNLYIGSANMDWRSLSQVKELGLTVFDCPCLAAEARKIFEILWDSGNFKENLLQNDDGGADYRLPRKHYFKFAAKFNATKPMRINLNGISSLVYLASSPAQFCPKNRENDLSAIKSVMSSAKRFVYISVMDYIPEIMYARKKKFWPEIDDHIKRVVIEQGLEVRLMVSQWNHSFSNMIGVLKSLLSFNCVVQRTKIQAKLFKVPFDEKQAQIPFARVNHNKYMVTDRAAYIGTSNWAGDYFTATAGSSIIIYQNSTGKVGQRNLVENLRDIFLRDWDSVYAKSIFLEC